MWTGRRFGMVLNAESRKRSMFETFASIVVQVDVRDVHIVQIQALRIHGETVILRGDLHMPVFQIQNRMVAAMVSKFQFVSFAAECEAKNLMT